MTAQIISLEGARIRRANRSAHIYGEHVTLEGDSVTREQCVLESLEINDEREET